MLFTETGNPNSNIDGGYVRAAVRDFNAANKTAVHEPAQQPRRQQRQVERRQGRPDDGGGLLLFRRSEPPLREQQGQDRLHGQQRRGTAASKAIYALPDNALRIPEACRRPAVQQPGRRRQLRPELHHLHQQRRGAGQQLRHHARRATRLRGRRRRHHDRSRSRPAARRPTSRTNGPGSWRRARTASPPTRSTSTRSPPARGRAGRRCSRAWPTVSRRQVLRRQLRRRRQRDRSTRCKTIFSEIQAVNSVFASVSLPVSVNTEGTYLNQIYIGMFRPDRDAFPRWAGNLKQYKLGIGNGRLQTQDADAVSAINNSTGFITECARSFWTPTDGRHLLGLQAAGRMPRRRGLPRTRTTRTATSSRRARRPTSCARRRPRALRSRPVRLRSCTAADRFQQHERLAGRPGRREHDGARSADQLGAGGLDVDDENSQRRDGDDTRPSAAVGPRRRRALAPGGHQHGHGRLARGRGVLRRQRRRAARHQRQPRRTSASRSAASPPATRCGPSWRRSSSRTSSGCATTRRRSILRQHVRRRAAAQAVRLRRAAYRVHGAAATRGCSRRCAAAAGRSTLSTSRRSTHDPSSPTLKWRKGCPNLADDTGCTAGLRGDRPDLEHAQGPEGGRLLGSGTAPLLIMGGGYDTCEDDDPNTCSTRRHSQGQPDLRARRRHGRRSSKSFTTDRGVVADVFVITDDATGPRHVGLCGRPRRQHLSHLRRGCQHASSADTAPGELDDDQDRLARLRRRVDRPALHNRKFMLALDVVEHPTAAT